MLDNQHEKHQMILDAKHPTGVEEWLCPTCGRRFLVQWPPSFPSFNMIILEAGTEFATHSGAKGGISIGMHEESEEEPAVPNEEELDLTEEEEARLHPWLDWMVRTDYKSLWKRDLR